MSESKYENGSFHPEPRVASPTVLDTNTNAIAEGDPSPATLTVTREKVGPSATKGHGLKKWRRIRRNDQAPVLVKGIGKDAKSEMEKENEIDSDSTGRMLKRGSDNLMNENGNDNDKAKEKEKEKGGSSTPIIPITSNINTSLTPYAFVAADNDTDAIATTFSAGADSEDSHTHSHRSSSKSSTAASAPKLTLRPSAISHHLHPRDKHKIKNSNHRFQLGKSLSPSAFDSSKKPRGGCGFDLDRDRERERENSPLSSLDSDSRSSNSVFIRTSACDQISAPNPLTFDAEHPSHSLPLPPHSSTATNHHQLPDDCHPLVDSILMLQSAQLALQTEVQKFAEIGKGIYSLCDDSDKTSGVPVLSVSYDPVSSIGHASDGLSEFDHANFSKIVEALERQLNEKENILKEKELRIVELETTKSFDLPQDYAKIPLEQHYKRCVEIEAELQDLFKQKIEAEVQSVVLARSSKFSHLLVEEWLNLTTEQKTEFRKQMQSPGTIVNVENKAAMRQVEAEKLDRHNAGIIDSEEILKMRRGVMKFTKYLSIQLTLLVFVFALFVLQFGPKSALVVPT
ncbi:WPP domain-interacting protein 2 [Bienertia sinuspersici]